MPTTSRRHTTLQAITERAEAELVA